MINRRDFMKSIVYGGALLPLINPINVIEEVNAFMSIPIRKKQKSDRAIFCIVDDPELEDALELCARELGCEILFDWPNSPELIFDHHFVSVIDGRIINEDVWNLYVDMCNEGDVIVPCLMVGDANHLKMPVFGRGNIIRFDRNAENAPEDIVNAITNIKTQINSLNLV